MAADADPGTGYVIYFTGGQSGGGWFAGVGGTSASAPLWASVVALADGGCSTPVGLMNPALYALAGGSGTFNDITTGNIDFSDTNRGEVPARPRLRHGHRVGLARRRGPGDRPAALRRLPGGGLGHPVLGPLAGGGTVTVTGAGLGGATAVDFGPGRPAAIVADTATSVTVTAPAASTAQIVDVQVTTPNGTSAPGPADRFAYGGYWEVASDGGIFAFGERQVPRLDGRPGPLTPRSWAWRPPPTAAATGRWPPTAGSSPSGTPPSSARWAAGPSTSPSWAWRPPPTAAATGRWPPTAASSPSGTPPSTARWARRPLNAPIVGMATTPDGGGYWEVASDGGLFAFGDAKFYGSMGGRPLNAPIVGLATTPDGGGYWEVASDGGLFAFGDAAFLRLDGRPSPSTGPSWAWRPPPTAAATGRWPPTAGSSPSATPPFFGSTGGIPLNAPVVAMAVG